LFIAIVSIVVLLITAFMFSGLIHDLLVPEPEPEFPVKLSIVQVNTQDVGGTYDHEHLPSAPLAGIEYDLGVRMEGLKTQDGVRPYINLTYPGLSIEDVEVYYFNPSTYSWWQVHFTDDGDTIIGMIGPNEGYDVDKDFEVTVLVLLTFSKAIHPEVGAGYTLL